MATHGQVVDSFLALRDALWALAGRLNDPQATQANSLGSAIGRAVEDFNNTATAADSPGYDGPVGQAKSAAQMVAAVAVNPLDQLAFEAALAASLAALEQLEAITPPAARTPLLQGVLRASPSAKLQVAAQSRMSLALAAAVPNAPPPKDPPKDPSPPYIASLVKLFPVEAVTIFPLGRGIAPSNAWWMTANIVLVGLFVGIIRFYATQDPQSGKPAWREIAISLISYLLWIGTVGGYYLPRGAAPASMFTEAQTSQLFGFLIAMWVVLVPIWLANNPSKPKP